MKTVSEDVLQYNPNLLNVVPTVSVTITPSTSDKNDDFATNSTTLSVDVTANESLMALSSASPETIQFLLQSTDQQLYQHSVLQYIQTHPFLQIYYLTFLKYLSSAVIALQALHSEFLQDTRTTKRKMSWIFSIV